MTRRVEQHRLAGPAQLLLVEATLVERAARVRGGGRERVAGALERRQREQRGAAAGAAGQGTGGYAEVGQLAVQPRDLVA